MRRNPLYQTFISPCGQNFDTQLFDAVRDSTQQKPTISSADAMLAEPIDVKQKYVNYLSKQPKRIEGGKSTALAVYKPRRRR